MIDTIMEAAQIDSGAIAVTRQQLDIRDSLKQLKAEYESVTKKDLILTWNWPDTLPIVLVDHQKLKRILQHLINNAIKFTETGTVTVSAKLVDPQDAHGKPNDLSSEPMDCSSQRLIEFEVSDTGIGIPEESLPIIFDMFKQVDSSNTRSYEGAGLGLYIVKQYTELLGGTIDAKSTKGGGSTFTVRIPCDSLPGPHNRPS
jgi:signal transduction histidine kinase